MKQIWRYR